MGYADGTVVRRQARCPMSGCGGEVAVPVPAGHGENRWVCPECLEPLEYSVSTGKLTTVNRGKTAVAERLVNSATVARRLGVRRGMVGDWGRYAADFPEPVTRVGRANLWSWPDVAAWARATGRLKN